MQDFTKGPVSRQLLRMTSFMLVTMVFQTLYFLVDLYWVGRLGKEAVAGVSIAGNLMFIVLALTQMLAAGTTIARCRSSTSPSSSPCWRACCSSPWRWRCGSAMCGA